MSLTIAAMPAFNEERSIAKMVLGCKKYVDLVVVIDDGSSDTTAEIAEALGAYVVRHVENMGYGAALRSCFDVAKKIGADKMAIIDADGQHDPAEIPKLLEPLDRGVDLVIGSRFCNGNGQNIPSYRKVGMRVLDLATNTASGIQVSDSQSGFRAYGKEAIDRIRIDAEGMSAGSEILLQVNDNGFELEEVEIHCSYDVERASTENPISHGAKVLWNLLLDMELKRPLYYFTIPGLILASIGILIGFELVRGFFRFGALAYGPALLMILIVLIGVFMAFTGIILHSISGLIDQSIKRLDASARSRGEPLNSERLKTDRIMANPPKD